MVLGLIWLAMFWCFGALWCKLGNQLSDTSPKVVCRVSAGQTPPNFGIVCTFGHTSKGLFSDVNKIAVGGGGFHALAPLFSMIMPRKTNPNRSYSGLHVHNSAW